MLTTVTLKPFRVNMFPITVCVTENSKAALKDVDGYKVLDVDGEEFTLYRLAHEAGREFLKTGAEAMLGELVTAINGIK